MIVYNKIENNKIEDNKMEHSDFWRKLYIRCWRDLVRIPRQLWYIGKNATVIPLRGKPSKYAYEGLTDEQREQLKKDREQGLKEEAQITLKWLIDSRNNTNVELGSFILEFCSGEDKKPMRIKIENCDVKETLEIIGMGAMGSRSGYRQKDGFTFILDAYLLKAEPNCLYFTTDRRSFELHFHEGTTYSFDNTKIRTIDATTPSNPDKED